MANNPVNWFEIYVQDMERAKKFYKSVFNVKLNQLNSPVIEMWAFPSDMNSFGTSGALVKMEGLTPGGISTIVYFSTKECSAEVKRIIQNGGRIHKDKMDIGEYGFYALAYDT